MNAPIQNNPILEGLQARLVALLDLPPYRAVRTDKGFGIGSIKGPVRSENQDRTVVAQIRNGRDTETLVALVCDGMGGLERGGDAATLAASAFLAYLAESQIGSIRQRLLDAVLWANRSVFDSLRGRGGTTLTALIIGKSKLSWCAHVGDSRLYVRQNKNEEFVQVSRDDTLGGVLSDGRSSDDNPSNGLLQYVGMGEDLQPHVSELSANGDSTFVLTTDGVHGIQQSIVREVFRAAKTVEELTKRLLTVAEAIGTRDNASVVTMHPAEFVAERSFEIGRSLTIWTTSERLDIWLPVAFNYDLSERRNPPRVPDEGKKIPHPSASKRKKSPKTKVKHQKSLDVESSEKPQLRIEFSDSDPKADD